MTRLTSTAARTLSVAAGAWIEYRQIVVVREAQVPLILLGLWFMSVPPALWLDSLRRVTSAARVLSAEPKKSEAQAEEAGE